MGKVIITILNIWLLTLAFISIGCQNELQKNTTANTTIIVRPKDVAQQKRLATKETRRYLYLRTGKLLPIVQSG
jgi:hypothetical protein